MTLNGGDEMPERLYLEHHYKAFFNKLKDPHILVLSTITENNLISTKDIIETLKEQYSKNPIVNAIDALLFAGLIDFKYEKKQHRYYLSEDGKLFNEYASKVFQEEEQR